MTVNTSSLVCFKRETTAGTAIITAVDTATSYFGGYSKDILNNKPPTIKNEVNSYWSNGSRNPTLIFGSTELPEFTTTFHPCSPICDYQFLGVGDEDTLSTITRLDTDTKDSYTIRHEERGGTSSIRQAVGCFCVGIHDVVEMNKEELVEQTWAYQTIEDAGVRTALTTMPTYPESIETVTGGKPEVIWDYGDSNVDLDEVWKAEWSCKQNYDYVRTGSNYTIKLHEYESVTLTLMGILKDETQWDALFDQSTIDIKVRSYKADTDVYKDTIFTNCKVIDAPKTGKVLEGAYVSTISLICESYSVSWPDEFGANFTDWIVNGTPA